MQDRVRTVMAQIFNIEIGAINDTSSPESIERWDSLRHMQLVLALEDEFGIMFADDDIPNLLTTSAIEDRVGELTS